MDLQCKRRLTSYHRVGKAKQAVLCQVGSAASLLRTAQLVCPQGVDHALWEKAIVVNWNDNIEIQNFVTHLETSGTISVQEGWDSFQHLLTCCVLDAYDWLSTVGLLSPEVPSVCSRMAHQTVWKSQLAAYKRSSCPCRQESDITLVNLLFGRNGGCWLGAFNTSACCRVV